MAEVQVETLSPEELSQQEATPLPDREALTILSGVPMTPNVPMPTSLPHLPAPGLPDANPGGTYNPDASASSTTT